MKLLFLAPQPFFQERGTPIAVRLALEVLARRAGEGEAHDQIDLVTYHEGQEISIPGVKIHRTAVPKILSGFLKDIRPGISFKKLICDLLFAVKAFRLLIGAKERRYQLVHAVEESVFIALFFKFLFKTPYIYDMDSSLAIQVTDKWRVLKPFFSILAFFEKQAVKHSIAVAPVCDALAIMANQYGSIYTQILRDVSLIDSKKSSNAENLRSLTRAKENEKIIAYIGNLEPYQGIDLLLRSLAELSRRDAAWHMVLIGGAGSHSNYYSRLAGMLGIGERTHFLGPKPLSALGSYIEQADILVSPRIKGNNTPMKIYSYLHSGKPIVATDLPTHTQVLTSEVSMLCDAEPISYSQGLFELLVSDELCIKLGLAGRKLADQHYTFEIFQARLNELYDAVGTKVFGSAEAPKLTTPVKSVEAA